MKLKFNGSVYGRLGFTPEDGDGVCFTWNEYENRIKGMQYNYKSVKQQRQIRVYLYNRDHKVCRYCKKYLNIKQASIDHYFPPETYHIDDFDIYNSVVNLVLSCKKCNYLKGKKQPTDFTRRIYTTRIDKLKRLFYGKITSIRLILNGTKKLDGTHRGYQKYNNMTDFERKQALKNRFKTSY